MWVGIGVAVLIAPVALLYVAGVLLSREHRASVSETIDAPPDRVLDAITDVEQFPRWRTGVSAVEVTSREPLRWRERGDYGEMTFELVERGATRVVTEVRDDGGAFGGRWTFALEPEGERTRVTITEDGWIQPPIFRTLSRFVFGYEKSARTYLAALKAHLAR